MNITISGASGLVGRRLMAVLRSAGHQVHILSRRNAVSAPEGARVSQWDPAAGPPPCAAFEGADVVVHLAGEPVAQRWTPEVKQRIRDSRVQSTRHLLEGLASRGRRPEAFVCASAIGYYGSRGDEVLTESSPPGAGFLPEVCVEWERAAGQAATIGMRLAIVRIGVVLDPAGGALGRMLPPFRAGVGGPIGSGRQWMSWIHAEDLAGLFRFVIENSLEGVFNGVAPFPLTNRDFTRELARALRRPAILPVPAFALKILFGEMAQILLESQRVSPRAAEAAGFRCRHPQLAGALADLLRQ
ncbi:MAG TPA: TIGR01777 family oxidoreductase [Bryobacteraceae bacterium]|nr:TIGR01777 family oxidoreductase [Bryobacteraceae bacterium]